MKKIVSLLLAVMLLACLPLSVSAATAGDEVTINFTAQNLGFAGYAATVNYDSSALELISISASGMYDVNGNSIMVMSLNPITDANLFTATFKVLPGAEAGKTYNVTATVTEAYDENVEPVALSISGGSITIDKPVCEHVWDEGKVTKEATCTEDGVKTYTCTVAGCGETKTETIAATGHSFGEWKVTKAATCTEKGEEARECVCGEKETREIAATGHSFGEWKVTKAATCTEKGEEARECVCGEKETREIAATGHSFGEWKVTKAATCTEKGEEARECACGEKETREISVVEHALNAYGKDSTHHWALCDNCDYVGEKEAHSYDYNGVCVCGATKPVVDDPNLDDVPQTGDITPYITMIFVSVMALAASAAFVLKRKAVK